MEEEDEREAVGEAVCVAVSESKLLTLGLTNFS